MMTNPIDIFKNELSKYSELTEQEWKLVTEKISFRELDKNEHLISKGQICSKISFITKGLIRYCQYDNDNNENTTCFGWENSFCAPFSSFINHTPSIESLIALEKTQLIEISREDFSYFIETIPCFSIMYRQLLEQAYLYMENHNYILQNYTAVERYKALILEDSPELLQRVPLVYLASYLGINPETLSRVRKKI